MIHGIVVAIKTLELHRSAGSAESLVALFQKVGSRSRGAPRGDYQGLSVQPLKGMTQRGAVMLLEYVVAHLDDVVRADAKNLRVESAVVNRAHCHAVRHDRLSPLRVLLYVGGIQEFGMAKPAECALR